MIKFSNCPCSRPTVLEEEGKEGEEFLRGRREKRQTLEQGFFQDKQMGLLSVSHNTSPKKKKKLKKKKKKRENNSEEVREEIFKNGLGLCFLSLFFRELLTNLTQSIIQMSNNSNNIIYQERNLSSFLSCIPLYTLCHIPFRLLSPSLFFHSSQRNFQLLRKNQRRGEGRSRTQRRGKG